MPHTTTHDSCTKKHSHVDLKPVPHFLLTDRRVQLSSLLVWQPQDKVLFLFLSTAPFLLAIAHAACAKGKMTEL